MSIWDDEKKIPNIKMKTMGGEVFWENIEESGEYRLQRNILLGNCRILDTKNIRLDYGSETSMRAKFHQLVNNITHAVMGDVICVHRMMNIYDHYGVYKDEQCVYEYNLNKKEKRIDVHKVTLKEFVGECRNYSILSFPEYMGAPGKMSVSALNGCIAPEIYPIYDDDSNNLISYINRLKNENAEYHIYSAEETIKRAESKLGEREYNLFLNNCEHFAIWCKTGLWQSHQIEGLILRMNKIRQFRKEVSKNVIY